MSYNILLPIRRRYVGIRKAERLEKILHRRALHEISEEAALKEGIYGNDRELYKTKCKNYGVEGTCYARSGWSGNCHITAGCNGNCRRMKRYDKLHQKDSDKS